MKTNKSVGEVIVSKRLPINYDVIRISMREAEGLVKLFSASRNEGWGG